MPHRCRRHRHRLRSYASMTCLRSPPCHRTFQSLPQEQKRVSSPIEIEKWPNVCLMRWRLMTGVDDGDFSVARPESGAVGGGWSRSREGATVRRASTPDDMWRRGRSSDPKMAGEEIFMVASLRCSSPCFCRGSTVGIIRRQKTRFSPGRVEKIPRTAEKSQKKKVDD